MYSMHHVVSSRNRRGLRLHGGRAAAPARRASRRSRSSRHRRLERRAPPSPTCTRRSAAAYGDLTFAPLDAAALDGLDVAFLALPHGESQKLVPEPLGTVGHVVDLGADFRLPADPYAQWYGEAHTAPELLDQFAFGMVELFRDDVARRRTSPRPAATRRPRRWRSRRCWPQRPRRARRASW